MKWCVYFVMLVETQGMREKGKQCGRRGEKSEKAGWGDEERARERERER